MKKIVVAVLLVSMLFVGCSNSANQMGAQMSKVIQERYQIVYTQNDIASGIGIVKDSKSGKQFIILIGGYNENSPAITPLLPGKPVPGANPSHRFILEDSQDDFAHSIGTIKDMMTGNEYFVAFGGANENTPAIAPLEDNYHN